MTVPLASTTQTSDIIITVITLVVFLLCTVLSFFFLPLTYGYFITTVCGSLAFWISVIIVKPNLLIPLYAINWVIVGVMTAAAALAAFFRPRLILVRQMKLCSHPGLLTFLVIH